MRNRRKVSDATVLKRIRRRADRYKCYIEDHNIEEDYDEDDTSTERESSPRRIRVSSEQFVLHEGFSLSEEEIYIIIQLCLLSGTAIAFIKAAKDIIIRWMDGSPNKRITFVYGEKRIEISGHGRFKSRLNQLAKLIKDMDKENKKKDIRYTTNKCEIRERSQEIKDIRKSIRRLEKSGARQKVIRVNQRRFEDTVKLMRDLGVSGTVKNIGGNMTRSVRKRE